MRDMEDRMGREAASYQDTIGQLEADIAKMKVIALLVLKTHRSTLQLQIFPQICLQFCSYF